MASTARCEVSWLPPTTGLSMPGSRIEPGRVRDVQRAIAAAVGLDLRSGDRLDGVVDRRHGDERRGVERTCDGIVGAAEVEARPIACDLDPHADGRRLAARPVIVEEILALVDAVGQARDRLAHLRLGKIVQPVERGADGGRTMLLAEAGQATLGRPRRRHLGQKIALALGGAAQVGQQEVAFLLVDAVGRAEAQRRDAHALLPGLGGGGEIAARPGAADVAPMGQADGEGEQTVLPGRSAGWPSRRADGCRRPRAG